jgi:cobalt-zinc-cadmium efflux system protein
MPDPQARQHGRVRTPQHLHHDHDHAHDSHDHDHAHGYSHTHAHGSLGGGHVHLPETFGRAFAIGITLNTLYVLAEAGFGVAAHSVSLIADAAHNLADVLGLVAAWGAIQLSQRPAQGRFTYGFRGSSILAALGNGVALLVVTGGLTWESIRRLIAPAPSGGETMMVVAACGVLINGATALLFLRGRESDLNIKGAFLHMLADALLALGVVVAGGIVVLTGWQWVDPVFGLVIGGIIVLGTWSLLRDSAALALSAAPRGIDLQAVHGHLASLPGVTAVHDLHVWAMSTTETALTAHIVRPGVGTDDEFLHGVSNDLCARFAIGHVTLQVEADELEGSCALAADPACGVPWSK